MTNCTTFSIIFINTFKGSEKLRKWDKIVNRLNNTSGMIVDINNELETADVRLANNEIKTYTWQQLQKFWYTAYAIKKPGPKIKKAVGRKPKRKKPGPKPKCKYYKNPKFHRSKYYGYLRYIDIYVKKPKKYRRKVPVDEIVEYIKDIAINQFGMSYSVTENGDHKFRTPYKDGENGYSNQVTIMVRKYKTQVNLYTKAMWIPDEKIKNNPRMLYQKYYYDKMMRIPNLNGKTKEFIVKLIACINENYTPPERPKTYNRKKGKRNKNKRIRRNRQRKED